MAQTWNFEQFIFTYLTHLCAPIIIKRSLVMSSSVSLFAFLDLQRSTEESWINDLTFVFVQADVCHQVPTHRRVMDYSAVHWRILLMGEET